MVVALVLTVAATFLGATAAGAAPTSVPLTFEFTGLHPGESQSQSRTYRLGRDARVVSVTVGHDARGDLDGAALPAGGRVPTSWRCVAGHDLAAGDYDLRVGVTATSLLPGDVSSIGGRLSFVETGTGNLAQTGSDPWPVSLAALAMTAFGLLLVAGGPPPPRRRAPRRHRSPPDLDRPNRTATPTTGVRTWTPRKDRHHD